MIINPQALSIQPFIAMDVLEKSLALEAQGRDIVHLEVGEPDFDTPESIKYAAQVALAENYTHYTHSLGLIQLRQAIAKDYFKQYGVKVSEEQILITSGSSIAFWLLFAALLQAGDEVVLSDPCYACYPNFLIFLNTIPVRVPVSEQDAFQYKPEDIAQCLSGKTRAIVINSPSNPTGQLLSAERMQAIAELAAAHPQKPYIISDEIYHGLVYDQQKCHSILEFTQQAFVLGGFSKLYAMTGWRLAYLIAPLEYIRPLQKMHQNFAICAPSVAQWAALAVYTDIVQRDVQLMVAEYDKRRKLIVKGLQELGFSIPVIPQGAFYVFTRCDHLNSNDYELAFHILENGGVALTPGRDFGPGGHGFIRLSYANSIDNIKKALDRLKIYLQQYYPKALPA